MNTTIETIADLLLALSDAENQRLKDKDIKHPSTIGAMYEGLTADILKKAIFEGLNLVVAKNSFIKGSQTELDVVLAEGEGEPIPHTDRYVFAPEQVLAVIQVKKNLDSREIENSFNNLQRVIALYEKVSPQAYMDKLARTSIRDTLQRSISDIRSRGLSYEEIAVYDDLLTMSRLPITIVIGYNGLKSEFSLRQKVYSFLKERRRPIGLGPIYFPSLIICGGNSIISMSGVPFSAPLTQSIEDGWWDFLASSHYNPMRFFLEMLWTKLSAKYSLTSDIFGDDLDMPRMAPFMSVRAFQEGEREGWHMRYHPRDEMKLSSVNGTEEWTPAFLDEVQKEVMVLLCDRLELNVIKDVPQIDEDARRAGYDSVDALIQSLCDTGLVSRAGVDRIQLTAESPAIWEVNGQYVMADNRSGRLYSWLWRHYLEPENGARENGDQIMLIALKKPLSEKATDI